MAAEAVSPAHGRRSLAAFSVWRRRRESVGDRVMRGEDKRHLPLALNEDRTGERRFARIQRRREFLADLDLPARAWIVVLDDPERNWHTFCAAEMRKVPQLAAMLTQSNGCRPCMRSSAWRQALGLTSPSTSTVIVKCTERFWSISQSGCSREPSGRRASERSVASGGMSSSRRSVL